MVLLLLSVTSILKLCTWYVCQHLHWAVFSKPLLEIFLCHWERRLTASWCNRQAPQLSEVDSSYLWFSSVCAVVMIYKNTCKNDNDYDNWTHQQQQKQQTQAQTKIISARRTSELIQQVRWSRYVRTARFSTIPTRNLLENSSSLPTRAALYL